MSGLERKDMPYDEVVYSAEENAKADLASRAACDACRKMKIKCIGKENPPCKRCKHMKLQCRFAMPPIPRAILEETEATKSRIDQLEGHVSGIYQKLDEMSSLLIGLARPPAGTPSDGHPESGSPRTHTDAVRRQDSLPNRPVAATRDSSTFGPPSVLPRSPSFSSLSSTPWSRQPHDAPLSASSLPPGPASGPLAGQAVKAPARSARSRSDSVDSLSEEDPIESAIQSEPFKHFTRREEEAHFTSQGVESPISRTRTLGDRGPAPKRRRTPGGSVAYDVSAEWGNGPIREKPDPLRMTSDPVAMGYCSEEEGRSLMKQYYKYAAPFIPVFDPEHDTWDSLRRRSPFCITVIILVGLRQRESTGPPSERHKLIKDLCEGMVKETLFSPVSTLETVQGLAVLCSYSEHAWRTCSHAVALAVDMRLYRCLPYLHKIRTDSRQPNHLLERQRPLVVGARVWLALNRLAYELSFNNALPVSFHSSNGRCRYGRELVDHPYSNLADSRLVMAIELCEVREMAFWPYDSVSAMDQAEVDEVLRRVNRGVETVYEYWLEYYQRLGLPSDHFYMNELNSLRAYAIMYANSPAWQGVRKNGDVALLSRERQEWVSAALRAGAFLVGIVSNKRLEKESEFGNHNFHVGIVATARYLIRMVELLPNVCDLFQISLDIDRLLAKLPLNPVKPFADNLRRTLAKARQQGILPYTQMSETQPSPTISEGTAAAATQLLQQQYPGFNPFPWQDPLQVVNTNHTGQGGPMLAVPGHAVPAAAATGSGNTSGNSHNTPMGAQNHQADSLWPQDLNLSAWFPAGDDNLLSSVDVSALDNMSNWFPAAPQVWLDE